ncbi:RNA methyltransferase [Gloeocapsa sp. PCC 73106]|uniref:RNA methyltransferase n=1 Tax=Gloeocapsa sp. PCC 73106 TaxID=102232 RepID=UPI0002AC1579|nr:RNA methyltransferase [Gloeocapsa sp. PCC 73106]ELR96369.1 RNA methyltransferase, TrmH family, group 1 [Gloeocapsa sp. PCC 73106]
MLNQIRIILVEPAGALNIGSVARIMKNMGLKQLVLVKPHCDRLAPEARQMAVHAIDILTNALCVETIPEALTGCKRAIATTARVRDSPVKLESPKEALPWLLHPHFHTALIFGPEDRGLSNQELNYAQRFINIPSNPEYPSLNLAQAVAICSYELSQLVQQPVATPEILSDSASLDHLEAYYQQLETLLLKIGYLYPHTAAARMAKLRRLYHQAQLSEPDVTMLRGILSQVNWALEQNTQD